MDRWIQQTHVWGDGASSTVLCPTCAYDYTHLGSIEVNQGGNVIEIQHWPEVNVRPGAVPGRGTAVSLRMWCEAGHSFAVVFQFHKGQTFVKVSPTGTFDSGQDSPAELWRD